MVKSSEKINGGKNQINFYDIDMTQNNIGTYGGPHSWDNYWSSSTGKARVYHLDFPFEIWTGQPNIRAEAVHQN